MDRVACSFWRDRSDFPIVSIYNYCLRNVDSLFLTVFMVYKFHLLIILQYFCLHWWFINSASWEFCNILPVILFVNYTSWECFNISACNGVSLEFCNITTCNDGFPPLDIISMFPTVMMSLENFSILLPAMMDFHPLIISQYFSL